MNQDKIIDIEDLTPDAHNFNQGTDEGRQLMQRSLSELGAGRSILVDRNGNVIAGNKTQEAAIKAGIRRVRVIETDGTELVAVKRTDIDIDSAKGRELALVDNLATQVNLAWDEAELEAMDVEGFDPGQWGYELPNAGEDINPDDFGEDFNLPNEGKAQYGTMTFTVTDEQRDFINFCIDIAKYCEGFTDETDNKNANGAALKLITKEWIQRQEIQDKSLEELQKEYEGLRLYLRDALNKSGRKASDVDKLLGTEGMSGHYFNESQWMWPTREAYEKMKTILPLDRDYLECKIIEKRYIKALKLKEYGTL